MGAAFLSLGRMQKVSYRTDGPKGILNTACDWHQRGHEGHKWQAYGYALTPI
jgi:hypothetical protein